MMHTSYARTVAGGGGDGYSSKLMAHEAEIIIPGSLVVLQGNEGDGMSNTIDTLPTLDDDEDDEFDNDDGVEDDNGGNGEAVINEDEILDVSQIGQGNNQERPGTTTDTQQQGQAATISGDDSATSLEASDRELSSQSLQQSTHTLGQLAARQRTPATVALNRISGSIPVATAAAVASATGATPPSLQDSFVLVSDDQQQAQAPPVPPSGRNSKRHLHRRTGTKNSITTNSSYHTASSNQQRFLSPEIEQWQADCRNREIRARKEWRQANARQLQELRYPEEVAAAKWSSAGSGGRRSNEDDEEDMWWQSEGRLALFSDIPSKSPSGVVIRTIVGTLSPGATVVATDIAYLNSYTFERERVLPMTSTSGSAPHRIFPRGKFGWIQLVKLEVQEQQQQTQRSPRSRPFQRPRIAYAVMSIDGYSFLTPGLPSLYIDPEVWIWRVTCPAGAFVREGLELNTRHVDTIPYGSLVRVTRKTVNSMGLPRLRVQSVVDDDCDSNDYDNSYNRNNRGSASNNGNKPRVVDGWCSEYLNPLSGQRGTVCQPVSFPVPALYRVTLQTGAVIRSDVELSSSQTGHAPFGAILTVIGRAFSEHPMDLCIERLKLAGNGGWISVRLNKPPPQDEFVVELIGIDGTFEPDSPGNFHLEAQRKVMRTYQSNSNDDEFFVDAQTGRNGGGEISSIDDSNSNNSGSSSTGSSQNNHAQTGSPAVKAIRRKPPPATRRTTSASAYSNARGSNSNAENDRCLICLTEERNATIVHGETGHVACCLVCARILKARGDKCPVCRLTIDSVIQHFWA